MLCTGLIRTFNQVRAELKNLRARKIPPLKKSSWSLKKVIWTFGGGGEETSRIWGRGSNLSLKLTKIWGFLMEQPLRDFFKLYRKLGMHTSLSCNLKSCESSFSEVPTTNLNTRKSSMRIACGICGVSASQYQYGFLRACQNRRYILNQVYISIENLIDH